MKKVLVLAGAPGAGKGTLSKQLKKLLDNAQTEYSVIEMSAILKKDEKFQSIMAKGALVKDEDVIDAIKSPLLESKDLVILDGFPRTIKQARFLEDVSDVMDIEFVVLKLIAEEDIIIKRVENRRICKKCGEVYNLYEKKLMPKVDGICDICGGELGMRPDDKKIRVRLETYNAETEPAIQSMSSEFETHYIDSNEILQAGYIEALVKDLRLGEEITEPIAA